VPFSVNPVPELGTSPGLKTDGIFGVEDGIEDAPLGLNDIAKSNGDSIDLVRVKK